MISKCLQLIGLLFDIWGAWVLAKELRMSEEEIKRKGTWGQFLKESQQAKNDQREVRRGFFLLVIGFALQVISTIVSFWE